MNKTALCIQMLEVLYSRNIVGISELAKILETNPRNIPEYRKELEQAGYMIDSVPGRYGGYKLNKNCLFPSVRLEKEEQDALLEGFSYLNSRKDFMKKGEFGRAMAKFAAATSHSDEQFQSVVINKRQLAMPEEEIKKRYDAIQQCIKTRRVMEIDFLTTANEMQTRTIHPYKLFMYNNAWFTLACSMPNKPEEEPIFVYYKLNRIIDYRLKDAKFRISLLYNEHDFFDENGLKKGRDWAADKPGESHSWYHIKLIVHGRPAMVVKEYIYGKNQQVTAVDRDTTILECDMEYRYNTVQFVLGLGVDCEIVEPDWLKNEVLEIVTRMKEQLEKAEMVVAPKEKYKPD